MSHKDEGKSVTWPEGNKLYITAVTEDLDEVDLHEFADSYCSSDKKHLLSEAIVHNLVQYENYLSLQLQWACRQ
ncbi:hypothetical protein CEXT_270811 [Caerostris extrusa]|uniref:Uncharacterized protein n=1 Tax=Caerostris extrusa TaxID=172846 RepID=A0AAV4W901_CAEEX|nr:hypothetical protein CEXT_270811 [Caerostris extrusa]